MVDTYYATALTKPIVRFGDIDMRNGDIRSPGSSLAGTHRVVESAT